MLRNHIIKTTLQAIKATKNLKTSQTKLNTLESFSTVASFNNYNLSLANPPHSINRFFAKKGKKALEKEQKQEKKAQPGTPAKQEIDLNPLEEELQTNVQQFEEFLSKMKFGRLTPEHFAGISCQAYGDLSPVTDLCQIITKNATTVALNVFDTELAEPIRRALQTSSYDFDIRKDAENLMIVSLANPNSKEVKQQFLKEIRLRLESCKKNLRNIRSTHINEIQKQKETFGKDIVFEAEKEAHSIYEKALKEIENLHKQKESAIQSM